MGFAYDRGSIVGVREGTLEPAGVPVPVPVPPSDVFDPLRDDRLLVSRRNSPLPRRRTFTSAFSSGLSGCFRPAICS